MARARWHEVHDKDHAIGSLKTCLQDQSVAAITAVNAHGPVPRRNEPAAMLWPSEQGGEARIRIEARPAEPIYRAISADKRCRLAVAN
jgi:hypothetical protein